MGGFNCLTVQRYIILNVAVSSKEILSFPLVTPTNAAFASFEPLTPNVENTIFDRLVLRIRLFVLE